MFMIWLAEVKPLNKHCGPNRNRWKFYRMPHSNFTNGIPTIQSWKKTQVLFQKMTYKCTRSNNVKAEGSKILGLQWGKHRDTFIMILLVEKVP